MCFISDNIGEVRLLPQETKHNKIKQFYLLLDSTHLGKVIFPGIFIRKGFGLKTKRHKNKENF